MTDLSDALDTITDTFKTDVSASMQAYISAEGKVGFYEEPGVTLLSSLGTWSTNYLGQLEEFVNSADKTELQDSLSDLSDTVDAVFEIVTSETCTLSAYNVCKYYVDTFIQVVDSIPVQVESWWEAIFGDNPTTTYTEAVAGQIVSDTSSASATASAETFTEASTTLSLVVTSFTSSGQTEDDMFDLVQNLSAWVEAFASDLSAYTDEEIETLTDTLKTLQTSVDTLYETESGCPTGIIALCKYYVDTLVG